MRSNFLCMSPFPANIPAKPAPFSSGLGNGDNRSFQPNLDLTLPKRLTLKLATNYLPAYLSHPFQVLISSLLLIKNSPNIFSNFLSDFRTSLKGLLHVFSFTHLGE